MSAVLFTDTFEVVSIDLDKESGAKDKKFDHGACALDEETVRSLFTMEV